MTELGELLAALKRELKRRGLSYRDVAAGLGLSEASVKRLFSTGHFTLDRLLAVCAMLDLTLADLTREAAAGRPKLRALTPDQEAELVSDPKLMLVAVCVLNHWSAADIVAHYRLTDAECIQRLARLDRMRLIDLLPGNRARVNVERDFDWLPDGPIRRYFGDRGLADFLAGRFEGESEAHFFLHGMLTAEAKAQFQAQLRQLRKRFAALHDEGMHAPLGQRRGTGLLVALREWELPEFTALRR